MKRIVVALAVALTPMAFGASPAGAATTLAQVKAATAKYQNVNMALANGYRRFGPCISSPQGAIGLHYVNRRLFASVAIIPRQPEAIVYMPRPGGGLRLGAVAYAKVGGDRPRLWGVPFKGPMIEAGMPKHYDLHVWIWQPNPRGLFAQFNPSIRC